MAIKTALKLFAERGGGQNEKPITRDLVEGCIDMGK